ncbi:uncharacterized protein LOC113501381 [Trichoplusia ni]|uniref:Uncharacterized protein LOC113501381 n=1 Tax=Trichoplusia ni TaxID=7111 RepID=A0A7E5WCE1_TRINI|nr:uncharacterized protein LOC113501381 [Trichoplusia ni]
MSKFDTLPILLVSAVDEATANRVISDIIDTDVTDEFPNTQPTDRVWRLINKYYTANVRVHPLVDGARLEVDPDLVEAHIIHISETDAAEAADAVKVAARRAAESAGAWRGCGVRLLQSARGRGPLRAWAAAERAELLAPARGPQRARDALHAHVWPGLVRTDRPARPVLPPRPELASGSSSSGSDDSEAEELRAVEHAEAFAAALGALGEAERGASGAEGAGGADRHARAEALVAAFCRAMGYDLDAC